MGSNRRMDKKDTVSKDKHMALDKEDCCRSAPQAIPLKTELRMDRKLETGMF